MFFEDKNLIARKIRSARKTNKLTQEELAEKIGITAKQLSRIENATHIPSLLTFFKIIEILNIDLNDFGFKNKNKNNPIRNEIDKILLNSSEKELKFYLQTLKILSENFYLIKN